ncbi:hypothetical protein C8R44DRAFT_861460 [Mycena epipterygia]|nr:hypothetical protein C8R44DRAFT_861460 [Mycena epipterygia]
MRHLPHAKTPLHACINATPQTTAGERVRDIRPPPPGGIRRPPKDGRKKNDNGRRRKTGEERMKCAGGKYYIRKSILWVERSRDSERREDRAGEGGEEWWGGGGMEKDVKSKTMEASKEKEKEKEKVTRPNIARAKSSTMHVAAGSDATNNEGAGAPAERRAQIKPQCGNETREAPDDAPALAEERREQRQRKTRERRCGVSFHLYLHRLRLPPFQEGARHSQKKRHRIAKERKKDNCFK